MWLVDHVRIYKEGENKIPKQKIKVRKKCRTTEVLRFQFLSAWEVDMKDLGIYHGKM